jgi:hypothetical protein
VTSPFWFNRNKALLANIAVSLTAVMGGVVGYFLSHSTEIFASYLVQVAAGGFIYIAGADLIPELKEGKTSKKTLATILMFVTGVVLMMLLSHHEYSYSTAIPVTGNERSQHHSNKTNRATSVRLSRRASWLSRSTYPCETTNKSSGSALPTHTSTSMTSSSLAKTVTLTMVGT